MDFAALEKTGWSDESVVSTYDALFRPLTATAASVLLDAAGVARGTRVLDVACGPGTATTIASERGAWATGVDFSAAMVRAARAGHPHLRFEEGDAANLPFPDASFEAVTCNFGLLHFPEPARAMREAARVLTREGKAAWSVWDAGAPLFSLVAAAMESLGLAPALPPAPDFFQFADPERLERAIEEAGLDPLPSRRLAWSLVVESPDLIWNAFSGGGVRTRAGILALPIADRERVRVEVERRVRAFERRGAFAIPVSCLVGSGVKR